MNSVTLFLVGIGGFAGSICRYLVTQISSQLFPYSTLIVNVTGCFCIGLLGGLAEAKHFFTPEIRALVFIGFLGGFTTYSTFGYEVITLCRSGQIPTAFINLILHMLIGLGAVLAGILLSRLL